MCDDWLSLAIHHDHPEKKRKAYREVVIHFENHIPSKSGYIIDEIYDPSLNEISEETAFEISVNNPESIISNSSKNKSFAPVHPLHKIESN